MKRIKIFSEVWNLPLRIDGNASHYVWSDNDVIALTFAIDDLSLIRAIVDRINGKACEISGKWERRGTDFYRNGKIVFIVRGWGHLTGSGGLCLPPEEAARVQDEFCDHIMLQLTAAIREIRCPQCGRVQGALVRATVPFPDYTNQCAFCGYVITESEFDEV